MPKVRKEITVNAPVDAVYGAWHNFENFPRFMDNIEEVRMTASGRSHWKAKGPLGTAAEWDAEVTLDEPQQAIGWRSIEGNSSVQTAGRVNFEGMGDATKVAVVLEYEAPAGAVGNVVTKIFADPERQVEEDLERFKTTVEKGREQSGFVYSNGGATTTGDGMGATTETDNPAMRE